MQKIYWSAICKQAKYSSGLLYFGEFTLGKFPIADKAMLRILVCKKCKARNPRGALLCRKCNYPSLRPKRAKKKETKA